MVPRENESSAFAEFWREKAGSIVVFLKVAYSCPSEFTVESRSLLEVILDCHNFIKINSVHRMTFLFFVSTNPCLPKKKGYHIPDLIL